MLGAGVTTRGAIVGIIAGISSCACVGSGLALTGPTGGGGRVGTGVTRGPGAFVASKDMTEGLKLM